MTDIVLQGTKRYLETELNEIEEIKTFKKTLKKMYKKVTFIVGIFNNILNKGSLERTPLYNACDKGHLLIV